MAGAERKWLAESTSMSAAAYIRCLLGWRAAWATHGNTPCVYIAHWTLVQFRKLDIGSVELTKYL